MNNKKDLNHALKRYFSILEGKAKAKFLLAEDIDERIEKAKEIMESCSLCERRCGVNRLKGETGFCGVTSARIASDFIHVGEESFIIPSYTIFFSGCTFRCVFCQNWDISQYPEVGRYIKPEVLAEKIARINAINVNWVGGDPTPNLAYILEVLKHLKSIGRNIPQIWNSNMYLSKEAMELLDGVIDLYLTDFKYGNDSCAERLSAAPNYFKVVSRNHLLAKTQAEVVIRHLVMPNHLECCTKPILEWISKHLNRDVVVNIMAQYRPEYKAFRFEDINRRLSYDEFLTALNYGKKLNLLIAD